MNTAYANTYQKINTLDAKQLLALLVKLFPKVFRKPVPLKIGIHRDIMTALRDAPEAAVLSDAMRSWIETTEYQRCCRYKNIQRRDLAGNKTGVVTVDERKNAIFLYRYLKIRETAVVHWPTGEIKHASQVSEKILNRLKSDDFINHVGIEAA